MYTPVAFLQFGDKNYDVAPKIFLNCTTIVFGESIWSLYGVYVESIWSLYGVHVESMESRGVHPKKVIFLYST
jgi:hypothetical protein